MLKIGAETQSRDVWHATSLENQMIGCVKVELQAQVLELQAGCRSHNLPSEMQLGVILATFTIGLID